MATFKFEIVWPVLMWFVAVVLILLAALFIFFVIKNYLLRRRVAQEIQPDHVVVDFITLTSVLSVSTVASENGSEEEDEETVVELIEEGIEQSNGETSDGDPDVIVVATDVHIPDEPDICLYEIRYTKCDRSINPD